MALDQPVGLDLLDLAAVGAVVLLGAVLFLFALGALKRAIQRRTRNRRTAA